MHRDQAAVSVLEGVRRLGERRSRTKHDLSYLRLDAIAADDGIRLGATPILEPHLLLPIGQSGHSRQPLAEASNSRGQKLDQVVEESGPMDSILAKLVRDRERRLVRGIRVAIQVIEPYFLLGGPPVFGAYLVVGFCDSTTAYVHGLYGVGAERDAGPNFSKGWCLLVDRHGDGAVVQCDCEGEAGYAATDHGHFELFELRHTWLK